MKLSKYEKSRLKNGCKKIARHGGCICGMDIVCDLSVNVNPAGPPEIVKGSALAALDRIDRYPDYYSSDLKAAASGYYGVNPECIVCGNGTSELLDAIGRVFAGKKVLLPIPCYTGYERAFRHCETETVMLYEKDDFDITDRVISIMETMKPDALVFGNPSNPVGRLTGKEMIGRLLDAAAGSGCTVIIDESFIEICDAGEGASSVDVIQHYDNLIILRSLTKSYAVPGLRLGFALTCNSGLLSDIEDELPEWNISAFATRIGTDILSWDKSRDYLERSRREIIRMRGSLVDHMTKAGIRVIPGSCGYILANTSRPLYEEMLEKKILVRDCGNISGLDKNWYRLAVCEASASIVF